MNVRAIRMTALEVRALLDGRKTQHRVPLTSVPSMPSLANVVHRAQHAQPYLDAYCGKKKTASNPRGMSANWCWWTRDDRPGEQFRVGYAPGDLRWVQETWSHTGQGVWTVADAQLALGGSVIYRAEDDQPGVGWFPSIHMPRRFSRLTLHVTDVRVQRVQEISRDDAIAEGLLRGKAGWTFEGCGLVGSPISAYAHLWRSIHGANAWDDNDWVAAITFTVEKANVDGVIARAG